MASSKQGWTDKQVEQAVGVLLRIGVMLSAAVVAVGAIFFLCKYGTEVSDHRTFDGEPERLRNPIQVVRGALALRPRSLIQLGLLLLIGTPVARVFLSIVAFAPQRDLTYVLITLLVLTVLLFSLFTGT